MSSCANHRQIVAYVLSFKYIVLHPIYAKYSIAEHPNMKKVQYFKINVNTAMSTIASCTNVIVLAVSTCITRQLPASKTWWRIEIISIVPTDFESRPRNLQ